HGLNEIERHIGKDAPDRCANADVVDLAAGDAVLADEVLELPGDEPIDETDSDGKRRVVEWKEDIAEAEQIAPGLARIAFGRLRAQRLAPFALARGRRMQGLKKDVLYVLHGLFDNAGGRFGIALEANVIGSRLPAFAGTGPGRILQRSIRIVGAFRPAHRDVVPQHVRWMQECAAAAGGNEVHVELVRVIAIVMMPIAGNDGGYARSALAGNGRDLEEILFLVLAG